MVKTCLSRGTENTILENAAPYWKGGKRKTGKPVTLCKGVENTRLENAGTDMESLTYLNDEDKEFRSNDTTAAVCGNASATQWSVKRDVREQFCSPASRRRHIASSNDFFGAMWPSAFLRIVYRYTLMKCSVGDMVVPSAVLELTWYSDFTNAQLLWFIGLCYWLNG